MAINYADPADRDKKRFPNPIAHGIFGKDEPSPARTPGFRDRGDGVMNPVTKEEMPEVNLFWMGSGLSDEGRRAAEAHIQESFPGGLPLFGQKILRGNDRQKQDLAEYIAYIMREDMDRPEYWEQ